MIMTKFFVSEKVANTRLAICDTCEHFKKEKAQCILCGCFMKYKTKMILSECPIKKWRKHDDGTD